MSKIAVIAGSYFEPLHEFVLTHKTRVKTPYGEPSSELCYGILNEQEVVVLSRRGVEQEKQAPQKLNYRANLWALRDAGVTHVIASNAVAGINDRFDPGTLVCPDQLIDYTYGRENTFFGDEPGVSQVEFEFPYATCLRQFVIQQAQQLNFVFETRGTFGITQGPRLETHAEVNRLQSDGCDFVGMTGMPEAALAKELNLAYVCLAVVVQKAAGKQPSRQSSSQSPLNSAKSRLREWVQKCILNFSQEFENQSTS